MKQRDQQRSDALILQRLVQGPATVIDLAQAAYGDALENERDNVYTAICRLRKRGIAIAQEPRSSLVLWRHYYLANTVTCPYCAGTGELTTKEATL